jgi:hypothetical protein
VCRCGRTIHVFKRSAARTALVWTAAARTGIIAVSVVRRCAVSSVASSTPGTIAESVPGSANAGATRRAAFVPLRSHDQLKQFLGIVENIIRLLEIHSERTCGQLPREC